MPPACHSLPRDRFATLTEGGSEGAYQPRASLCKGSCHAERVTEGLFSRLCAKFQFVPKAHLHCPLLTGHDFLIGTADTGGRWPPLRRETEVGTEFAAGSGDPVLRTMFDSACTGRCTRKGYAASVRRHSRQRLRYSHRPLRIKGEFHLSYASAAGRRMVTSVPPPSAFSSVSVPLCMVTISSHTARPMPLPRALEVPL